jgi:integrase
VLADRHRRVNEDGYGGLYDNERRTPINIAETPSRNTLVLEYSLYNALMNFAVEQKYIPAFIRMNYDGLPTEEPTYQARYTFNEAEIKKIRDALVDELRSDREAVWDDETGLQRRDEYGEPMWETFVSNPNLRRCRHNLRGLVLLMLTTGMRVQECLDLRWKHIAEGVTDDSFGGNFRFLTIRVKEKKSRRRVLGFRTVYVPYHMKKILGRLKPINAPNTDPDDYVFSKIGGKRYGLLMRRFNQLIRKLGIYESPEGAKRTLTHLRSYYASEQLQHQPLAVVASQMGHTIQVLFDFYTQIAVGKRAYDILRHIEQPRNIVEMANARHLADD